MRYPQIVSRNSAPYLDSWRSVGPIHHGPVWANLRKCRRRKSTSRTCSSSLRRRPSGPNQGLETTDSRLSNHWQSIKVSVWSAQVLTCRQHLPEDAICHWSDGGRGVRSASLGCTVRRWLVFARARRSRGSRLEWPQRNTPGISETRRWTASVSLLAGIGFLQDHVTYTVSASTPWMRTLGITSTPRPCSFASPPIGDENLEPGFARAARRTSTDDEEFVVVSSYT